LVLSFLLSLVLDVETLLDHPLLSMMMRPKKPENILSIYWQMLEPVLYTQHHPDYG
jgi:hypothetical protein